MTSRKTKITALLLCLVMCFASFSPAASALSCDGETVTVPTVENGESIFSGLTEVKSAADLKANTAKVFYNSLNRIAEGLVKMISAMIPAPKSWINKSEYDDSAILKGRETYATETKEGNVWSLGYASRTLIPADFEAGKYYLGRDLTNRPAQGVYDDMRIRIAAIDDGSGEGITLIGAIDALGVNSTDVQAIRTGILKAFEGTGVKISGINIMSTHSHSALDTQGVSTEFFYKLFTAAYVNLFNIQKQDKLKNAEAFKQNFIEQSVIAATEAINAMEPGRLYFSEVDVSKYVRDKRGLIAKEDIPKVASMKFIPASGGASTYLTDFSCHPTSFSAGNGLVSSDYIYFLDKYIAEHDNGAHLVFFQGALGQLSRDGLEINTEGMSEWDAKGASSKAYGEAFGEFILASDYSEELQPILNEKHATIWLYPTNSILLLACKINLVNQQVCRDGLKKCIPSETGYVEFGRRVGFAMFPGEFYPETFWGHEIIGDTTWDGTEWPYESLHNAIEGVDIYCVSLANDATGYVLTDDNFAFLGHIIGDGIADETLSAGKHQGSYQIGEFYKLIENLFK